jgi:hypothetical protein
MRSALNRFRRKGGLTPFVVLWLNACAAPLRADRIHAGAPRPVVDEHLGVATTYAPWIFHEVHPRKGRQDIPAPVDFDGDLDGENNWENFPAFELQPTVYYAALASGTHLFLSYHLFHPRDWTSLDLGLHQSHENDGENLQVVVERSSGRVVLLFAQAHYRGAVFAREGAGFGDGEEGIRGRPLLLDGAGRPSADGSHAAVFVESGGHGIYGATDPRARVSIGADGRARFARHGLVLRPALEGETVAEPPLDAEVPVPYRLESTTAKLWPLLRSGDLVGEGRLLDGPVPYADARVRVGVPRYYEADRFSGPFGPDRGISPFALDFGFGAPDLGSLFFDPTRRYARALLVPEPWSLVYENDPFRPAAAPASQGESR